jgi:hypothetical protein
VSTSCEAPLPFEALIAYHMRELSEAEQGRVEEHYFACAYCSERLEVLSRLEHGVRELVQGGQLFASSTVAMVQRARAQGILVREYRTDPGEHVNCTAGPDDALLVTRYGGLRGITSVDFHFSGQIVGSDQLIQMEYADVPVDQQTGDLVLVAPGALNRGMPLLEIEVRLSVREPSGAHEVGRYHYHHRPWDQLDDDERQRRRGL